MGFLDWEGLQKFWNKCKSAFVTKDENGDVSVNALTANDSINCYGTLEMKEGYTARFWSEDDSKKVSLWCDDNGKLSLDGKAVATVDDIPSGGNTSSGESSITDLGEQEDHQSAERVMVDHLMQMNADDGCYLFKYYCPCRGNACFAVVVCKNNDGVGIFEGTVYDNQRSFRQFYYTTDEGFVINGCWLPIASFNEEQSPLETEAKTVINAINELNSKIGGGAGLSMPRIRVANWHYTELPTFGYDADMEMFLSGRLVFSVNVQDGTVQEGDELQVCAMRKTYGKYKLRPILSKTLTTEDLENLAKQPYLQVSTDDLSGNNLGNTLERAMASFYRTDSSTQNNGKPKYVRIRRPVWKENSYGELVVVNAFSSNVVPVNVRLSKYFEE